MYPVLPKFDAGYNKPPTLSGAQTRVLLVLEESFPASVREDHLPPHTESDLQVLLHYQLIAFKTFSIQNAKTGEAKCAIRHWGLPSSPGDPLESPKSAWGNSPPATVETNYALSTSFEVEKALVDTMKGRGGDYKGTIAQELVRQQAVKGFAKYGTYHRADNGRDHLQDALEEIADALVYLTAASSEAPDDVPPTVLQHLRAHYVRLCRVYEDTRQQRPSPPPADQMLSAPDPEAARKGMTLLDYAAGVQRTMPMPNQSAVSALAIFALGLAGEVGEVIEPIKKHLGHGHPLDLQEVSKEIGDALWYLTAVAKTLGLSISDVAADNLDRLRIRYPDGFSHSASMRRQDLD